jgi:SNF2 family DNA or RNA helicase
MSENSLLSVLLEQYEMYSNFCESSVIHKKNKKYILMKSEIENAILNNDYLKMYNMIETIKLDKYWILMEEILNMKHKTDIKKMKFENIKTELYVYQINNINWMLDIENNHYDPFEYITSNLNEKEKILLEESQNNIKKINFKGGGLFDEVGMGKTLQIITLINENKSKYNSLIKNNKLFSKASLIIIPNHLCGQWVREFDFHTKNKLKIIELLTKKHYYKYSSFDLMNADVIVVSSNFFKNCNLDQHENIDHINIIKNIFNTYVNIFNIHYHRIIIDEYHEIEDDKLFIKLKYLNSDFKWILSGTPFQNIVLNYKSDIEKLSITKIIDYLTDGSNNILKLDINNIFNYNFIKHHFSRNTHNDNMKILKLPDIRENIVWLNFTDTESAIYNSYLADPNNTLSDVFLRQICCHPRLSEQIRNNIDTKIDNVEDMDNIIKKMYFNDYYKAKENYDSCLDRINKITDEINEKIINNKTDQKTYFYLNDELTLKKQKLPELKTILDGKESQLTYYINFLKIIKNNDELQKQECIICMDNINTDNIGFTICGHIFCYSCIEFTLKNNHKCPLCNKILHKNELFYMNKNSDINAKLLGTKLAYLINYINQTPDIYRIIFSQWDFLLKEIGKVLHENNINHLYCQGNVYQKNNVLKLFNSHDPTNNNLNYKIIMLSSENTVSGSNLTKAQEISRNHFY